MIYNILCNLIFFNHTFPIKMSNSKYSFENFIGRSIKNFGKSFCFDGSNYINMSIKIKFICLSCGKENEMKPCDHLRRKNGCGHCSERIKTGILLYTSQDFIHRSIENFGRVFGFDNMCYIDANTEIELFCMLCNLTITTTARKHLKSKHGCKGCAITARRIARSLTQDEFLTKAKIVHRENYDYSKSKFIKTATEVTIICRKCGKEFDQRPGDHIYGKKGCSACRRSKGELLIESILIDDKIQYISQHYFDECKLEKVLYFDFYLVKYNLLIEYDGEQHFKAIKFYGGEENFKKRQLRDKTKNDYCIKNKINLLRISYKYPLNEVNDLIQNIIANPEKIKSMCEDPTNNITFYYFN